MNRRLLVDLEALAANYHQFEQASAAANAAVGAVVKADGYGTGAAAVAARLQSAGCASFFVASVEEGQLLREALGLQPRIFVFEGAQRDSTDSLAAARLIPILNHSAQLEHWRSHKDLPVAVHVDTGMSRLGFAPELASSDLAGFKVELLLTHLACADEPDHPQNARQIERFDSVRQRFPGVPTSIGNSAGWLGGATSQGDLARPGIGLYGGNPFSNRDNPFSPVASLQGRVLQVKQLAAGESVGYGATHVVPEQTTVAVIGIGYADGVPRQLSGQGEMALAGTRCPILGRVSMDMSVVDISRQPDVETGDWAECFGATVLIDEVAGWADTIAYEILTGVGMRAVRQYQPLTE